MEAWVDADLRRVHGVLTAPSARWDDPLARLPPAADALTLPRTTPGGRRRGNVRWSTSERGELTFEAELPKRFGGVGATRHGLFANGGWYPQDPSLPERTWDALVHLPPGTVGALGDTVGADELRWQGTSERVSLAVVPNGVVTRAGSATLLTRGEPRKVLCERISAMVPGELLVVEAPLRRRLARPGADQLLVSDRAWRAFGPLRRYHDGPIARAAAIVLATEAVTLDANAQRDLRVVRWIPSVDAILHDHNLPFYGDVFGAGPSDDPLQDDLSELYQPRVRPAPAPTARAPLSLLATGAVQTVQLNDGWAVATGVLILRRGADSSRFGWGALTTDQTNLVAGTLGFAQRAGRRLDGQRRRHLLMVWVEPALLSPITRAADTRWALGAGAAWTYRSRHEGLFAVDGWSTRLAADVGWLPEVNEGWRALSARVGSVLSPHPRLALAWRATGGAARSASATHRVALGGPNALRSVAPSAAPASLALTGATELRWVAARDLSVPLGFGWLSELQLTGGVEAGIGRGADGALLATGVTVGVAGVAEMLGVDPRMAGLTAAWPLRTSGFDAPISAWPTVYLRWAQAW